MPVVCVNRKGQTYYLHPWTTRTGGTAYFFSKERGDDLVTEVPASFEIHESPTTSGLRSVALGD